MRGGSSGVFGSRSTVVNARTIFVSTITDNGINTEEEYSKFIVFMTKYIEYMKKYNALYMSAGPYTTADAWDQTEFSEYLPTFNEFYYSKDNKTFVNICQQLEKASLNLSDIVPYNTLTEAVARSQG